MESVSMTTQDSGSSQKEAKPQQFERILNFRDVGTSINTYLKSPKLNQGLLYRSARPDEATPSDRTLLREDYKIKTIIDLRSATEHKEQEKKHHSLIEAAKVSAISTDEASPNSTIQIQPLRVEGLTYMPINFNGSSFSRLLISKLTWLDFFWMIVLMLWGKRLSAISILGRNVMQPRGLSGLALDSIDVCGAEVKAVFDVLSNSENYPVLVHCTQGKDRTGLVVQLVLMLLNIPIEAIDYDYMLTQKELLPEREEKAKEVASIGLTDDFVDCDPKLVKKVQKHIKDKHGSVSNYLRSVGVLEDQQTNVRNILLKAV